MLADLDLDLQYVSPKCSCKPNVERSVGALCGYACSEIPTPNHNNSSRSAIKLEHCAGPRSVAGQAGHRIVIRRCVQLAVALRSNVRGPFEESAVQIAYIIAFRRMGNSDSVPRRRTTDTK